MIITLLHTRKLVIPKIMRQLRNIACREFILLRCAILFGPLWPLSEKNDVEMYQRYMIFRPFCNTFASYFIVFAYCWHLTQNYHLLYLLTPNSWLPIGWQQVSVTWYTPLLSLEADICLEEVLSSGFAEGSRGRRQEINISSIRCMRNTTHLSPW